ncbi:MAG: hypothetical protein KF861_19240 [Planctomycetaceae bacterium]|nr:hypothetical protein [Planctomycetaceae bacterium]
MTLGRAAAVAAVVLIIAGGYQAARTDWAAYGPAALPDQPEVIDSSLVTLRSVRLGEFDALEETPRFTWSQFVTVKIEADCVPDRFHISDPNRRWGDPVKDPERFRSSLGLEFVRRSSIGDGTATAYRVFSGAKVDRNNRMSWSDKTWIPHVPGQYRVRVILITTHRDAQNVRHMSEPIVIGAFDLDVLPGEPAA